jgi:hypothetical protein
VAIWIVGAITSFFALAVLRALWTRSKERELRHGEQGLNDSANHTEDGPEYTEGVARGSIETYPPRRAWRPRAWKPAFELLRAADDPPPIAVGEMICAGKLNYLGNDRGWVRLELHFMHNHNGSSVNFNLLSHVRGWDAGEDEWRFKGTAARLLRERRHIARGVYAVNAKTRMRCEVATDLWFDRIELGFDGKQCIVEGAIKATRYDADWAGDRSDYRFAGVVPVMELRRA